MKKNIKLLLWSIIFLIVLIITYSNHFNNPFHFDDTHTIVNNIYIREIKNIPLFFTDITTFSSLPANQSYRPVVTLLNSIDYWLAGELNPFYFHLSIFFWFIILGILLFFLFQKLFNLSFQHKWNSFIALFAVFWYMLHTANTETINYIISRSDSFSTLCIVASLLLYQIPQTKKWHLYLITMIIGINTKETGLMFVPILFFYILFFEENISLKQLVIFKNINGILNTIKKIAPAFIIAVSLFLFNQYYFFQDKVSPKLATSTFDYFTTQFFIITHYIGNFILPTDLSADPDFTIITPFYDKRILLGMLVIILLLVAAFKTSINKKTRPVAFGILWFFIALAPTSSFRPFSQIANDHRTFFPYIGLIISTTWYIGLLLIKYEETIIKRKFYKFCISTVIVMIILAYAYGTFQRNKIWSSGELLWYDVTIKSPKNGRGLMNYGNSQMAKGKYDIALQYYTKALKLLPYYSYLHINLGIVKNAMGKPVDEVENHFVNALSYDKNNPEVYYYYAKWLYENKQINKAQDLLKKGLIISPAHSRIKNLINKINLEEFGTPEEKIKQLINTTQIETTCENYINLSLAYYKAEMYDKCIEACEEALKLRPDYALAYNNICSAYNMLGEWKKAIEACEKALKINPDFQLAKNNLNWAKQNFK